MRGKANPMLYAYLGGIPYALIERLPSPAYMSPAQQALDAAGIHNRVHTSRSTGETVLLVHTNDYDAACVAIADAGMVDPLDNNW